MSDRARDCVQYIPRLRRYARALTRDRSSADDLVQDTLERALSKIHLWRPDSDLRAWLFTIMHNVYANQLRSQRVVADAFDEETLSPTVRSPLSDRLEILDLQSALLRLPEQYREVLLLVGLEEMTYEETAHVLSIPMGTVMSRLSRARERLRLLLAGKGEISALKVVK